MRGKNNFDTSDFLTDFPDLELCMARLVFAAPYTLSDYGRFTAVMKEDRGEKGLPPEEDLFWRQYAAVLDGADMVVPYEPEALQEGQRPYDPDTSLDDLPMAWPEFVVEAGERYVGSRLTVLNLLQRIKRWEDRAHEGDTFELAEFADIVPALAEYEGGGKVRFKSPIYTRNYREWTRALDKAVDEKNGGRIWRELRGAVALVDAFEVDGVDWDWITAEDCRLMPLEIASWLIEACAEHLAYKFTPKKIVKRLRGLY